MIKLCKKCVNPSTRPNVYFNEDGICGVCLAYEENKLGITDWQTRDQEIKEIIKWGKDNTRSNYDCIVTVSGGKDSTRQAFYARDELGMNPLLVSAVYPPEELHERGAVNLSNLISHGFDAISIGLNPKIFKKLMLQCLEKYTNLFNASEMALYAIPIHAAIAYQIPLIFLGENPALTIGEKHGRLDGDASEMRKSNTLLGGDANILESSEINKNDLHFYNYPPEQDVNHANLRIVYLGYYIRDWSGWNNGLFSLAKGLTKRTEPPEHTGDLWGISALDEEFRIVNQYIKYLKFGFGHVTDQVMERIHAGEMTREEGLKLVKKFDGKCHTSYIKKLCKYLGITSDEFRRIIDKARNRNIWDKNNKGQWILKIDYSN